MALIKGNNFKFMPQQELSTEEMIRKIYENSEKTRKYILFGRIISFIYLILIIAPLIFAIIYLPPLMGNAIQPYRELLQTKKQVQSSANSVKDATNSLNLEDILKSLK